ncbi:MAG: DUF2267 domain-containing protein, partial [Candidatus Aenigmatarchaeota archaeon]
MDYKTILRKIKNRIGLEDNQQAEQLVRAVLKTLGERIGKTERENLGAQLPKGLKETLVDEPERRQQEWISLEEFYTRISERSGLSFELASQVTGEIMEVLREATSEGEMDDLKKQLPV